MNERRVNKWGGDATVLGLAGAELAPPRLHQFAGPAPAPAPAAAPVGPERPQGRWSRSPNVVHRGTLQGVMVLPPEGPAVVLSGVTAAVWEALAQPAAAEQLAERTAGDPPEVVEALRELHAMGAAREIR